MVTTVIENLGWYLQHGLITTTAAKGLVEHKNQAVKSLMPYLNDAIEALGCTKESQFHGPMARDYIAFNNQPNFDDVTQAGDLFDFQKGATQQSLYRARM